MRHEEKYICTDRILTVLEHRLQMIMQPDIHQKGDGYLIRSLYFDTADDRLYRESLYGVDHRSKYRIRFYDMNRDLFRMERKDTRGRLKNKISCTIDAVTAEHLASGLFFDEGGDDLPGEMYVLQRSEGLRPVAVVEYFRTAFTYPEGNVRVTIDRNISCSHQTEGFTDKDLLLMPVMPCHKHILEVKYDTILPGIIASVLDTGSLEQVSFSKYASARGIVAGNGRMEEGYEF